MKSNIPIEPGWYWFSQDGTEEGFQPVRLTIFCGEIVIRFIGDNREYSPENEAFMNSVFEKQIKR